MTFDNRPVAPVFLDSNPVTDGVANFAAALMNAGPAANQIKQQREAVELGRLWKEREWERQTQQDKLAALWHGQAQERQAANDARMGKLTDAQIANLEADNTRANLEGLSREGRGWVDSVGKLFGGHGRAGTAKEQKPLDVTKRLGEIGKDLGLNTETDPTAKEQAIRAHLEQLEKAGLLTPEDKGLLDFMRASQPATTEQKPGESGLIGKAVDAGVWTGARGEELQRAMILKDAATTGGKATVKGVSALFNAPFSGINVAEKPAAAMMNGVQAVPKGKIAAAAARVLGPVARVAVGAPATLAQGALSVGDLLKYGATGSSITGDGEAVGNMVAAGIKAANSGFNPEDKESTLNNWAYKNETVDPRQLWGSMIANGTIHPSQATPENLKYFMGVVKKLEERQVNGPVRARALKIAVNNFPLFGGPGTYDESNAKNDVNTAIIRMSGEQNAGN
jgi:hypothetical protein